MDANQIDRMSRFNWRGAKGPALGAVFLLRFLPVQKMKAPVGARTDNGFPGYRPTSV